MKQKRKHAAETGQKMVQSDEAKRLRELEAENASLKTAVAVLTVDKLILTEIVEENVREFV